MSDQPYVEPAHRIPDEQWGPVVRRANEWAAEDAAMMAPNPDAVDLDQGVEDAPEETDQGVDP